MVKSIDKVKKKLVFDPTSKVRDRRVDLYEKNEKKGSNDKKDKDKDKKIVVKKESSNLLFKLLSFSIIFFVAALAFAFFASSSNVISSGNIEILVEGPTFIDSGDTLPLEITVFNDNASPIEFASISLTYPDGTRNAESSNIVDREKMNLGLIGVSESVKHRVSPVVFGSVGDILEIPIGLTYRLKNSNAEFFIEKVYNVQIESSPITFILRSVEEVTSNEDFDIVLEIFSNSTEPIEDVILLANYPFGYQFIDSNQSSRLGGSLWNLGTINPSDMRTVRIRGSLEGQNNEEHTFRFNIGISDDRDDSVIASQLRNELHTVKITRPFIDTQLTINGESAETSIVNYGDRIDLILWWENNTQESIRDVELELSIDGDIINPLTVAANDGFYNERSGTILWNQETLSSLQNIPKGEVMNTRFSFQIKNVRDVDRGDDLNLNLSLDVKGTSEKDLIEKVVVNTIERTIAVRSNIDIISNALYINGDFSNTGPIPPKVGEKTTYTISIKIKNDGNPLRNAVVETSLPFYVSFERGFIPTSESASYNEDDRKIRWNIGDISRSSSDLTRELNFQISIVPTLSLLGSSPVLVNTQILTAIDGALGEERLIEIPFLTTDIIGDIRSGRAVGNVVR